MGTIRWRGDACQAIVRVKRAGQIVHTESQTFSGQRAEALAKDWMARLEKRIKQDGVPQRKLATATLGGLIRRYATARAAVKPLRRSMEHEYEQLAVEFDKVSLAGLVPQTFIQFATRRRAAGTGGVTVLHNLASVRAVLNAARPMFGLEVDGSPLSEALKTLANLGAVSRSAHRDRRPSDAELTALEREFQRIASHPSTFIPMAQIVALAVALPRRLGELTDMRWMDYDKAKGVMILRDTKHPTTPRTEKVPVPPGAAAIIADLPVIDERVLPYNSESVSASFERACKRLGIEGLHFHDLRHEGITRLFERGLGIQDVAMISGHQSWAMLRRYTNLTPESVLEKLNANK